MLYGKFTVKIKCKHKNCKINGKSNSYCSNGSGSIIEEDVQYILRHCNIQIERLSNSNGYNNSCDNNGSNIGENIKLDMVNSSHVAARMVRLNKFEIEANSIYRQHILNQKQYINACFEPLDGPWMKFLTSQEYLEVYKNTNNRT